MPAATIQAPELLTSAEAETYLGLAAGMLAQWRHARKKGQPKFRRLGRKIRYTREDLDAYNRKQTVSY